MKSPHFLSPITATSTCYCRLLISTTVVQYSGVFTVLLWLGRSGFLSLKMCVCFLSLVTKSEKSYGIQTGK